MKNKILSIFLLIIVASLLSCRNNHDLNYLGHNIVEPISLSAWISIGETNMQQNVAMRLEDNTSQLDLLYILIFNEEGNFIKAVSADLDNATTKMQNGDVYYKYTVRVPESDKNRILHFIGGTQDKKAWFQENFSQEKQKEYIGKNEGELLFILKPYKVGDASAKHFFWARQAYGSLHKGDVLNDVVLLRNYARIRVVNKTPNQDHFTIYNYYVDNSPKYGTLAPFNPDSKQFALETLTESSDREYISVKADGSGFAPIPYGEAYDLFERPAGSNENPFNLILNTNKGYYKLAFWDPETLDFLPIIRNHEYVYTITRAQVDGKLDLQAALNDPAFINPSLAVELKDYPKIADDKASLEVSEIILYYSSGGVYFNVDYTYKHRDGSSPNGEKVEIVLTQDEKRLVVQPNSYRYTKIIGQNIYGTISGVIANELPIPGDFYRANIRVRVGNLVRDVQVYLANKKEFRQNNISLNDHGKYGKGDPVDISLNVPEDAFPKSLYPIDFFIDSKFLVPNTSEGLDNHLVVVNNQSGSFKYKYRITSPGKNTIHFLRSQSNRSEDVLVSSQYYTTKVLDLLGGNGIKDLLHLRGKYDYKTLDGTVLPVLLGTKILAYPTTTRTNLRLEDNGFYVFDIFDNNDPRRPQWQKDANENPNITFTTTLDDGSKYKTQKRYNELKLDPDLVLEPFDETKFGFFINAGADRNLYSWTGSYIKSLSIYPGSNEQYEVIISSAHPANEMLTFRYRKGWHNNVLATATLEDLRLGRNISFGSEIAFPVQFSYIDGGQNRVITSFDNSRYAFPDWRNSNKENIYDPEHLVYFESGSDQTILVKVGSDYSNKYDASTGQDFFQGPILIKFSKDNVLYTATTSLADLKRGQHIVLIKENVSHTTKTVRLEDYDFFYSKNDKLIRLPLGIGIDAAYVDPVYQPYNGDLSVTYGNDKRFVFTYPTEVPDNELVDMTVVIDGETYHATYSPEEISNAKNTNSPIYFEQF